MIYLASPYSHSNPAVRELRFRQACRAAANLMRNGRDVYCPIAHGHPIAECELPLDWRYWSRIDRRQLERCREVAVLMIDGWQCSRGVQAEIRIASQLGKPVSFLNAAWSLTLPRVAKETGS